MLCPFPINPIRRMPWIMKLPPNVWSAYLPSKIFLYFFKSSQHIYLVYEGNFARMEMECRMQVNGKNYLKLYQPNPHATPPKNIPKNILTYIWKETNNKTSRAFPWNYFTKFWKKLRVQVVSMHLFHIGLLFGARDYLGADSYPYYRGGWIAVKKSLNLQWARRLFFTFFSLLISKEIWTAIFASTGLRFC